MRAAHAVGAVVEIFEGLRVLVGAHAGELIQVWALAISQGLNIKALAGMIAPYPTLSEIKEALEKSMAPGSQTFEQALFKLFIDGHITQDEAMANADSPTNMLWLINQATAGALTTGQAAVSQPDPKKSKEDLGSISRAGETSFGDIKIDMTT